MLKRVIACLSVVFVLDVVCVHPALSAQRMDIANAFYQVASREGTRGVQRLVRMGYNLEQTDMNGNTALCLATVYQDGQAFKALLNAGASTKARCFSSKSSNRDSRRAAAKKNDMIYLGGGLSDTIYGENREYIESAGGFVWENSYTVGAALLLLGGIGVALAARGHSGSGNSYVPPSDSSNPEEILSGTVPSCLGGAWTKYGDTYSCVCPTGKKLINGVCVDDVPNYQTNSIVNNTDLVLHQESDALLAELGASLVNNATMTGSTAIAENDIVALKVNGFSEAAYSGELTPDTELNVLAASKAVNNGIITLTQNGTDAGALYGIKAVAGATGLNSPTGTITLNVLSSNPAYALYAEQKGYGLSNQGTINLNLSGAASDTYALYTMHERGIVNQGTINILISNPIFNSSEADDVAAIHASDAQNSGKIFLRRGETDLSTAQEDNLNVSGLWVKDGGKAENTSSGLISLDVTKTPFYVHGMYASQGTTGMTNEGRIEIFGDLSSKESINGVGGAYAMRWTGGYGSIVNKGEIQSRTCIQNINGACTYENLAITGDAYLTFLSGFRGTINNQADLLLYVTNNAPSTSSWTLAAISLFANSEDNKGIFNDANIKINVTEGTVAKNSKAMAITTTSAYAENNGNIDIRSATNNLDLYGIAGYGKNGKYSQIHIEGDGANTILYGIAKSEYDGENYNVVYDPYSENNGSILLEHRNIGGMLGIAGQNYGTISLIVNPFEHGMKKYYQPLVGMHGETNTGAITLSMQKGSCAIIEGIDPDTLEPVYSTFAQLIETINGASLNNSGPLTFVAENRTVNMIYAEGEPEERYVSEFGIIEAIKAGLPGYSGSRSVTNSSVIRMDASGTTPEGYTMSGILAGINAHTYSVTNAKGAKIDIDLNGPGQIYGMYTHSGFFDGESLPAIYKTYNYGTIDIRATNTTNEPIIADNVVFDETYSDGTHIQVTPSTTDPNKTVLPFAIAGMITNSIAVNNGEILMQVAGDARSAAMIAYDGGIAINNGLIKFTGNSDYFTALYGTGYRTITETTTSTSEADKEGGGVTVTETTTTKTTTQYSTVYNYGTITINSTSYISGSTDTVGGGDGARCAMVGYISMENADPQTANQTVQTVTSVVVDGGAPVETIYPLDTSNYVAGTPLTMPSTFAQSSLSGVSSATTQSVPQVVLNEGVAYVSEGNGTFEAEGALVKGSVVAGVTNVIGSNQFTYVADGNGNGAIVGNGDSSLLSLTSASYMFDADFATNATNSNGFDIVMTKKPFEEVVENSSFAAFLEKNYALGNNEEFFNEIKSIGNASAFKSTMDGLTGQDTISRFTHEDLTAMREISLQMNETMFANSDKAIFETQGAVNGFAFKNDNNSSGQYALATKRIAPRWKVGYAMSKTNINTDNNNDTTRHNEMFQVFAPIGYENAGLKLISTPQIGFARGHYTRKGYNDTSFKGVMEKRIFALMNEARYPMAVMGGFEIAPTVEFNAIAYNQKGSEDKRAYSLTMPSDNKLSVEAGLGLYANKQIGNVKFNAGLMMYKEFADPYNIKMGMNGMEGTFDLYDEDREYRGVASFGFGYDVDAWNIYGKVQHFIENDNHTNMKAGIKYTF